MGLGIAQSNTLGEGGDPCGCLLFGNYKFIQELLIS